MFKKLCRCDASDSNALSLHVNVTRRMQEALTMLGRDWREGLTDWEGAEALAGYMRATAGCQVCHARIMCCTCPQHTYFRFIHAKT